MKILYVTSEASPYAASGGLGDVMGALPKAISDEDDNIKAEVILPLYNSMKSSYRESLEKVIDISFMLSWRSTGAAIYKIESEKVIYYFVENEYYFHRNSLYGEFDDAERFAFFSLAVIEFIMSSGNIPDIIHANDWQSALSVIYLKTKFKDISALSQVRTLYTIHNIEYQGRYDTGILGDIFGLDSCFLDVVEYNGCINLTKGAITVSDYVTTVSPNYANELKHDFFSFGLSEVIKSAEHKLRGVVNGIDYNSFSPDLGGDIYAPYTRRAYKSGKAKNKKALQKELNFDINPTAPLVVMITRLTEGKGIDLVLHIIEELLSENIQFAVLGTGEYKYEEAFLSLEKRYKNFRAIIKFDRTLSKKLYAAADIFIMPSKSEPCGLAQMIASSYGTVPIVRAVGGLYDTIKPYGTENSNGFVFNDYNAHELLYTVKSALKLYLDTQEWASLVKRTINSDFSWNKSAKEYISIYNNLLI
jgi:starch synthase